MVELEKLIEDLKQARLEMLNGTLRVGTIPQVVGIRYISAGLWYLESPEIENHLGLALSQIRHSSVPDEFQIRLKKLMRKRKI